MGFNPTISDYTTSTPASATEFNSRQNKLVENDNYLNDAVSLMGGTLSALGETVTDLNTTVGSHTTEIGVLETTVDVTFVPNSWTRDTGTNAWKQTKTVSYMLESYRPIIQAAVPDNITTSSVDDYLDACALVTKFVTGNGNLTAYCYVDYPTIDVVFTVKGR